MYRIVDAHEKELSKEDIDNLFWELNKELRKKFRKYSKNYKVDLYVVGGACIVTKLMSRETTNDIDAMWVIGDTMRDCINIVGDRLDIGHTWCNCDFKRTKSYTNAIVTNSHIYKEFDRLIVRMVNFDLLLAMKYVSYREGRKHDIDDIKSIMNTLRNSGIKVDRNYIKGLIIHYYGSYDVLSETVKKLLKV